MNINRNTYETYFLLYVDNELSAEERAAVETFVEENPDLRPELEMLQETVLTIDSNESFPDKALLFRYEEQGIVNAANCEEYFVRFLDNELNTDEQKQVVDFVTANPQYKEEFELIQLCKVEPDTTIVYKNKEELFRYEEDEKVVPFNWRRIAAAAVVVLMLGSAAWFVISENKGSKQGLADIPSKAPIENKKSDPASENRAVQPKVQDVPSEVVAEVVSEDKSRVIVEPVSPTYTSVKKQSEKKSTTPSNKTIELLVQEETPDIVKVEDRKLRINTAEVKTGTTETNTEVIAIDEAIDESTLRSKNGMNAIAAAPTAQAQESNVIYIANTSVSKKNKLRGFFRTASRIVERATNFEPSQNENKTGIRIANFEIDLK